MGNASTIENYENRASMTTEKEDGLIDVEALTEDKRRRPLVV